MPYTVRSAYAKLFAAPDKDAECVDEILSGMSAAIIETLPDGWVQIRTTYQYEGYIPLSNLAPLHQWKNAPSMTVFHPAADVLRQPAVRAPLVECLPLGATVYLLDSAEIKSNPAWVCVGLSDGRSGWIRAAFLQPCAPICSADTPLPEDETLRTRLTACARLYRGTQYRWGGKTPWGIDCSGLCAMAYWLNGLHIYRDAKIMPGFPIREIPPHTARKGDLLFFPGHVAMLLSTDEIIHASDAGGGVGINTLVEGRPGFRADLAQSIIAAGSVFASEP